MRLSARCHQELAGCWRLAEGLLDGESKCTPDWIGVSIIGKGKEKGFFTSPFPYGYGYGEHPWGTCGLLREK